MRPVPLLMLTAVAAIAMPLASCGGDQTASVPESTTPPLQTAAPAPSPVKKSKPKPVQDVEIPGASPELKACLGDKDFYAVFFGDKNARIETKEGVLVASLLGHDSVADAEKFTKTLTVKDPLVRGKVSAVVLGTATAKQRRALSSCFEKL